MKKNQPAAANMLHFSATFYILHFLNSSGSGSVAYIKMPDSHNTSKHMNPTPMPRAQI